MPTPVEVSLIKRSAANPSGIEGLGGMWRDAPWYLSECSLIWEICQPDSERQWDFFVAGERRHLPVIVELRHGRKVSTNGDVVLFALPEWVGPIPTAS